ncbi:hypothetical protein H112_00584 [Trichophyton rubrum D6]|uniref:Uncharacterized protein n=3 Tax=Trichophyton TaxID=5550 RepID=F2T059_TRIRC|nr:uncharacterized protein TERG_08197 [Trichophyton rubrum CBS 118892]EZF27489.1 hypothetical protein H100_00584 [Trichophyton rubrum MR850]EZF46519.1 hypothetical protein H102_00584 [Trichophyton rubrum CBS 100081]EZF57177.1 hypothetical protein H103_00584 [Trichophyton rubrum CBS 288.86]EZF67745.1 hypothetical protein H104_00573 [Trichophyton rubrum CBS 289.86]EZF78419.1 hypothetical protein H105_00571 [Trichophyton soudanense CBS 452.61]EZF89115.1 hypothetical protein H110_00587 [Trichophy
MIKDLLRFISDHALLLVGCCIILIIKAVFGIGPNFDMLFARMQIFWDWVSINTWNMIRALQPWDELVKEEDWAIELGNLARRRHIWIQRQLFLRETIIEYAIQGKLEKVNDLDNGSKDWQGKLLSQTRKAWALSNEWYEHHKREPTGPIIRISNILVSRKYKYLRNNPTKHLLRQDLRRACRIRDGCCARACQCCIKPRGLYPDKRIYYAHCTLYCGCCIRSRGFVKHRELVKDVDDLADFSITRFSIEDPEGFKVL